MISIDKYIEGIESIYVENPDYKLGHDGSDGYCDCIGMCKGAIRRAGGNASGLSGTNFAARNTILNLEKIPSASVLTVGTVVLKGRQPGSSGYSLPDQYKSGSDLTDYYHIGTVTKVDPLEITHMTSPKAKKDKKLGTWNYYGWLPQVENDSPEPGPEPEPDPPEPVEQIAVVVAENGKPVNLRKAPYITAALVDRVPVGETVTILEYGDDWCKVKWTWKVGYMMTKFLAIAPEPGCYTVSISGLTQEEAEALKAQYPQAEISVG